MHVLHNLDKNDKHSPEALTRRNLADSLRQTSGVLPTWKDKEKEYHSVC